jgi:hypothetical protein
LTYWSFDHLLFGAKRRSRHFAYKINITVINRNKFVRDVYTKTNIRTLTHKLTMILSIAQTAELLGKTRRQVMYVVLEAAVDRFVEPLTA